MKKQLIIAAFSSTLFASCEKVIDVKLDNANPQFVIEAELFEGTNAFKVHVAKTTDYFGTAPQQQVNDAVITLSDDNGISVNVPLLQDGWYELQSINAIAGKTYHINVIAGGREFTASATMPYVVNIDSISIEFKDEGFRDKGYEVGAIFNDPAAEKNYYRLIYSLNDTVQNKPENLYLFNDKYNDGKLVKADLRNRYDLNDKIEFELRGMDEKVFNYFTSLRDILENGNGPAPANPNTNIKGGALGYFGAFTSSKKAIVITD